MNLISFILIWVKYGIYNNLAQILNILDHKKMYSFYENDHENLKINLSHDLDEYL